MNRFLLGSFPRPHLIQMYQGPFLQQGFLFACLFVFYLNLFKKEKEKLKKEEEENLFLSLLGCNCLHARVPRSGDTHPNSHTWNKL